MPITKEASRKVGQEPVQIMVMEKWRTAVDASHALELIENAIGEGDSGLPVTFSFTYEGIRFRLEARQVEA